jgi:competence protein ComEC
MVFLEAVSPIVCIISAGKGNPFGFPSREILERLNARGCRILRVDEVGATEISMGRDGPRIKSFR